jgi:WD40 repeat protein
LIGRTRSMIRTARLSPDRRRLAVLSGAATVDVWRLDRASSPETHGFAGSVRDVAITPDRTSSIAGGDDGIVRVFDVISGRLRDAAVTGHGRVRALAVDAQGRAVLTGGDDGTVRRWLLPGLTGGTVIATHRDAVTAIGIARDGTVATGSADRTVVVTPPGGGPATFDAGSPIYDIVFDAKHRAISLGDDRRVIRWTVGGAPELLHAGVVNTSDIAVSADGKRLVVVGSSPQTLIDLESGARREIPTGAERWQYAAFSPDGRLFVSGTNRLARIVDPEGLRPPRDLAPRSAAISDAEWSADGALVATAGDDGLAGLWNAGDGTFAWGRGTQSGAKEVVFGPVTFRGHADGLVTATGVAQAEVLQFRLHGAIVSLELAGDVLVATSMTGDRATVDISRLRVRGCDLVRAVRAEIPIATERGAIVPARPGSRCR